MILCNGYPQLLNLYGDYANPLVVARRLANCGKEIETIDITVGTYTDFSAADMLFFGAATERRMLAALGDLRRYRAAIEAYCARGGLLLATGTSLALFCKTITDASGTPHEGLGLFDADVAIDDGRRYGEFIMQCELVPEPVVGSINTSITVTSREAPLFSVDFASAPGVLGKFEGMQKGSLFASQLSGPLLVRNPALLDWFAQKVYRAELGPFSDAWYIQLKKGYENVLTTLKNAKR